MASSTMSNYLSQKTLDLTLKGTAFTPPTSLYVALFTTSPQLDNTGGVEVSTSGTGYQRVELVSASSWSGPSGSSVTYSNIADITFAVPTANWGTITGIGLYDALTDGNLYFVGYLSSSKTVENGDSASKILAGNLRISRAVC